MVQIIDQTAEIFKGGWYIRRTMMLQRKYPVMVENHGGPILNYGDRFLYRNATVCIGGIHGLISQP
jgi:hypothetical protein